jgi:hypothetical protein
MKPTPNIQDLRDWTDRVRFKDEEWDEKLRRLYPRKDSGDARRSDAEFDDAIPF